MSNILSFSREPFEKLTIFMDHYAFQITIMEKFMQGDRVVVNHRREFSVDVTPYLGKIWRIDTDLKNKGDPSWGVEDYHYVEFDNPTTYDNILLRGWSIYCKVNEKANKCIIRDVYKNKSDQIYHLVVIIDDGKYNLFNTEYKVSAADILAILISRVGYDIKRAI